MKLDTNKLKDDLGKLPENILFTVIIIVGLAWLVSGFGIVFIAHWMMEGYYTLAAIGICVNLAIVAIAIKNRYFK